MLSFLKHGMVRRQNVAADHLWSEDSVQAQIEGCRRNREVYEKLASQMGEAGYHRTGQQCTIHDMLIWTAEMLSKTWQR